MISPEVRERLQRLLNILKGSTLDGKIRWERLDGQVFEASAQRASFTIRPRDGDGIEPFVLDMYDSHGTLVTSILTSDDEYPDIIRGQIRELYVLISTSAAQIVTYLDGVISDLEDRPPF